MQTTKEIMGAWFLEEKKSFSSMLSFFLEIKPNKCTEIGWSLNTEVLVWVPWVLCLVTTVLTCNILRVFLGKNMIWFFLVIDGLDFNTPGSKHCQLMTITNPCNGDMIILVLSVFYCEHNSLRIEQFFTYWIKVSWLGSKWWHRSFVSF